MRRLLVSIGVAVEIMCVGGCAAFSRGEPRNYQTVAGDPHRDTGRARLQNRRATRLIGSGKPRAAEQALHNALIADVTFGPAHNNLGKLYYARGEHYLAAWEFEYARRLMPNSAEPYNNLGLVYEAVERLDHAIMMYTSAYDMEPTNPQYIGNLARARLQNDDQDSLVHQLLSELILYDTRPDWVGWARELMKTAKLPSLDDDVPVIDEQPGMLNEVIIPEHIESVVPQHSLPSGSGAAPVINGTSLRAG